MCGGFETSMVDSGFPLQKLQSAPDHRESLAHAGKQSDIYIY